jgi:hypothetical protein
MHAAFYEPTAWKRCRGCQLFPSTGIRKGNAPTTTFVGAKEVFWKELGWAVGLALDAELSYPVAEGVGMDIQDFRRTSWPVNHSTCLLKGSQDMASLLFFHGGES